MPNLPLLLGHRGTRVDPVVAENTLSAFDEAIQHGCDGFEFDVRLAPDGRALVCHDAIVEGIPVAQCKPADLGHLSVLEEVLKRYANRAFLDIELKVEGIEPKLLELLRNSPPERDYVVSSFLPDVIMELRARSAGIPLGVICDTQSQLARWRELPVRHVIVHQDLCSEELVKQVHAANKTVFVWTVNDPAQMRRFALAGVDVIISDNPELLVRTLRPERPPGKSRT
jgi:glycerophosphoryl diester phosphodiesterase